METYSSFIGVLICIIIEVLKTFYSYVVLLIIFTINGYNTTNLGIYIFAHSSKVSMFPSFKSRLILSFL